MENTAEVMATTIRFLWYERSFGHRLKKLRRALKSDCPFHQNISGFSRFCKAWYVLAEQLQESRIIQFPFYSALELQISFVNTRFLKCRGNSLEVTLRTHQKYSSRTVDSPLICNNRTFETFICVLEVGQN